MEKDSIQFSNEKKIGKFINEHFISQEDDSKRFKLLKFTARWSIISAIGIWGINLYGIATQDKKETTDIKTLVNLELEKNLTSISEEMNQ